MLREALLAVTVFAAAAGGAELSIEPGIVAPGKQTTLNMKLAAGSDAPTGIQFDLEYDESALDIGVELGPAAKQASKTIQSHKLQPGKLRALIIGFNKNIISDGVLAVVRVSYKGQETGKTFAIRITGAAGTNENAQPVNVTARDGSVRVEIGRNAQ